MFKPIAGEQGDDETPHADLPCRTGVLCIFLCFALGVANIFHATFVIAFSIVCLYVHLHTPFTLQISDTCLQSVRLCHYIHRNPPASANLPNIGQVRHIHP